MTAQRRAYWAACILGPAYWAAGLLGGRMSGDEEQGVKHPPPVRLGEIRAEGVREHRQRGHELAGELFGIQLSRRAISCTAWRNLPVRPSRTSEAGTSGGGAVPARWLSPAGRSVTASCMPSAAASRVSAVIVGLPLPFSRFAI